MYPFEKYRYYTAGNKIIAVSTYAGKTVRGVAKCAEGDTFDMEKGKRLAALRCAEKIAFKRAERAMDKVVEAQKKVQAAQEYRNKMDVYYTDACSDIEDIKDAIYEILEDM